MAGAAVAIGSGVKNGLFPQFSFGASRLCVLGVNVTSLILYFPSQREDETAHSLREDGRINVTHSDPLHSTEHALSSRTWLSRCS